MAKSGLVRHQPLVYRMRQRLRKDLNLQKRGGYVSNKWLRKNPWRKQFNFNPRSFEPSKHKRLLLGVLLVCLSVLGYTWYAQPNNGLFHSNVCIPTQLEKQTGLDCGDPNTIIYQATTPHGDLSEFNTFSSGSGGNTYVGACNGGVACLQQGSDTSTTSVALTNVTAGDLSIASKSNLGLFNVYEITNAGTIGANDPWGYYLTTNRTVPTHAIGSSAAYDPSQDPSVVFLQKFMCASNCNIATKTISFNTYFLKTLGQKDTILGEDKGCDSGSVFLCQTLAYTSTAFVQSSLQFNYTGNQNSGSCTASGVGSGCSSSTLGTLPLPPSTSAAVSTQVLPWLAIQTQQYYLGFYVGPNVGSTIDWLFGSTGGAAASMQILQFNIVITGNAPTIDTGGVFGPVIRALINIGIFIFNAILGFIAFIVPALEAAFNFLESIVKTILNGVGSAFGFPSSPGLGDDLFNFINSVITLFTVQVPNAFGQITNVFNGWLNLLTVIFTTGIIGQIFKFLSDTLTFAINLASFAWTVFNLAALSYSIGAPWWLFIFAIAFNCDDGVEGWIKTWEFAKWISFDIGVKTITWLLNWTIDVVTAAIGFIPKPVIQMASAKFPRIPVIDIHGSFSIPRFDGAALKEGNLFAVFGFPSIVAGLIWYELTQTGIPGTLASLYSTQPWVNTATVAITFYKIFLPIFGLTIFLLMIPTLFSSIFGIRVQGGMPVSLGRRPSSGVVIRGGGGGPLIRRAEKHLQGRLLAKISAREKIEKRVKTALEKEKERLGEKATEAKAQAELAKKELARKASGKDIKGPRLGPLNQE